MRIKKKILFGALTASVIAGASAPCFASSGSENSTAETTTIKSRNTLKYQSAEGCVEFYGDDITFLEEKLSSIPSSVFDPGIYAQ